MLWVTFDGQQIWAWFWAKVGADAKKVLEEEWVVIAVISLSQYWPPVPAFQALAVIVHFLAAQDVWTCKRRGEGVHESKNKKGGGDGKMLRVDTIGRGKEKV